MANIPDEKETDRFLSKVDEIGSLIKDLTQSDSSQLKDVTQKADAYLKKLNAGSDELQVVQQNKNSVNNRPVESAQGATINGGTDKDAFMLMMEQDAKERMERKQQAEKLAMVQKELGNQQFKKGNYEKAVEFYSEALKIFKDTTVLWTNRAQAYNKLGQYEKALTDCDWATRVFENCLKAYIHEGKAHLGLKQFDQAIESYEHAMRIEPSKKLMIENYIKEVELARLTEAQEQNAREKESFGDMRTKGLVAVMQQFDKKGQLPMYYSGGLRILADDMANTPESRTMFRMHGGMNIIESHFLIQNCFNASPRSLGRDELDLCEATIETMKSACTNNEENQINFLELPDICNKLSRFLESKMKTAKLLKRNIAELLLLLTENDLSRRKLITNPDISRLLSCMFGHMNLKGVEITAMSIINNLALTTKFKSMMKDKLDEMLPVFEDFMVKDGNGVIIVPQCISTITNLCADPTLRQHIVARQELWLACVAVLENHTPKCSHPDSCKIVYAILGLLINLTQKPSELLQNHAQPIFKCCHVLLTCDDVDVQGRSFIVTSGLMQHSTETVKLACQENVFSHFVQVLKGDSDGQKKSAVKCLAICTQHNEEARSLLIKHPKGLKLVLQQLKHNDELIIGNAALCLGHCVSSSKALCTKLTSTSIIMDLLVLARDGRKTTAQHNCAILIAKLCQGHSDHLEKLRELHGLEILHDVMKHVKE